MAAASSPARDPSAEQRGVRARLRRTPGGRQLLKLIVFVVGLLFILLGLALAALPGPLTIPPILLGVWIWSSEFAWADRLLERAKRSAIEAWEQAKRRPVVSALVTGSGLVALGVGIYLVSRYQLVDQARDAVGL
ncbi:MAG: PGPGW domain-containing protein [Actinomycetes bacterium]